MVGGLAVTSLLAVAYRTSRLSGPPQVPHKTNEWAVISQGDLERFPVFCLPSSLGSVLSIYSVIAVTEANYRFIRFVDTDLDLVNPSACDKICTTWCASWISNSKSSSAQPDSVQEVGHWYTDPLLWSGQ